MSDLVECARLINVLVLVLTLVILGARINKWWCSRWRCLLPAAGTGFIALMISLGTVDALLHNRPGGAGVFAVLLGAVALLMQACTVGMGRSHGRDEHPTGGAYMAYDPARGQPCGPDDPTC